MEMPSPRFDSKLVRLKGFIPDIDEPHRLVSIPNWFD